MLFQYYLQAINFMEEKLRREEGQDLAEYALLVGLIAILVIAALTLFKTSIVNLFSTITAALNAGGS